MLVTLLDPMLHCYESLCALFGHAASQRNTAMSYAAKTVFWNSFKYLDPPTNLRDCVFLSQTFFFDNWVAMDDRSCRLRRSKESMFTPWIQKEKDPENVTGIYLQSLCL